MTKLTKGPSLTAGRGRPTATKMASTPQPQLKQANSWTQTLMRKGSFPAKIEPKKGGSWT